MKRIALRPTIYILAGLRSHLAPPGPAMIQSTFLQMTAGNARAKEGPVMPDPRVETTVMSSTSTPRRIDRRSFVGLGAAAAATVGGVAVLARTGIARQATPPAGGTPEASPGASPAASPVAGGNAAMVHTVDLGFEPNEFSIPANTDVTVTIENMGALQHDFVIDDLDVKSDLIDGGDSTTVTINADAGTYEFYCSVPGHKQAGMVGTLTVE
jgi:uncharacterized cupredoxin-like copper-binding protein